MFSFLVNIVTYFLYGRRIYPLGIYITIFTAQKQSKSLWINATAIYAYTSKDDTITGSGERLTCTENRKMKNGNKTENVGNEVTKLR